MFALLLIVIYGIIFALFSTQNAVGFPVKAFTYEWTNIPLYLVALLSLLAGVLLSWILSLFDWVSTATTLHGKDKRIQKTEQEVLQLQKKIHILEEENAQLRNDKHIIREEAKQEVKNSALHQSTLDRFRHKPAL